MPHIHEKFDVVVVGIPIYEDKVLIIDHIRNNTWLHGVGGHLELDEDPEQCLWREVEEECGLKRDQLEIITNRQRPLPTVTDGKQIEPPYDVHVHQIDDVHWHIALQYYLLAKTDQVRISEAERDAIREMKWVNRAELETYKDKMPRNAYEYASYGLDLAEELTG